jgi:hypothetical protein
MTFTVVTIWLVHSWQRLTTSNSNSPEFLALVMLKGAGQQDQFGMRGL